MNQKVTLGRSLACWSNCTAARTGPADRRPCRKISTRCRGLPCQRRERRSCLPAYSDQTLLQQWLTIAGGVRSEEHTSELQSLRHLVCRLLLEKKNHDHRPGRHIRPVG